LRILLLVRLYTAIYLSGDIFDTDGKAGGGPIGPLSRACRDRLRSGLQANFLKRIPAQQGIHYRCAMAMAMAPLTDLSPPELARHLVAKLTEFGFGSEFESGFDPGAADRHTQTLHITATNAGWIDFEISDRAFATWLNSRLPETWPILPAAAPSMTASLTADATADLWRAQYAHARCGAILRWKEASDPISGLISGPISGSISGPDLINPSNIGPDYPDSRQLALAILDVADRLEDGNQAPDRQLYLASGRELGRAFEQFAQTYQWGRPAPDPTRLGLVRVLQSLLQALLTQGLEQSAPTEL
jgi:hypothetical protein